MPDWADELAQQMAQDARISPVAEVLELWAARLRVVREEGRGEGIDACREALDTPREAVQ